MKKILLLEDDIILGETIEEFLLSENYEVVWVKDGELALSETFSSKFDIYLFDVNVPFINGFVLLQELRHSGDITPAIFITANIDIDSLKKGFDVGADDYLKKPFDFDELIIRIESLIKKSFKSYSSVIKYGDLSYDMDNRQLISKDNKIHLSPSEFTIIEYFLKNIGKVLNSEDIISQTNQDFDGSVASLRVQISKLKKLGFNITNIRSVGYRLEKL